MLKSPFFIEGTVFQTTSTGELDSKKLESLGYFTRARLDTLFPITTPLNIIPLPTPERVSGSGSTPSPVPTPVVVSPAPKDPPLVRDLTFFTTPSRLSPTVVGLSDEIVLRGSVPNSVDSVYIGSYRLKTYVKGSGTFTYRARLDIGNLRNGENIYTLSFETAGIRQEKETLRVWMISDPKLRAEKIASLTPVPMTSTGTSGEESGSGTDLLVSTTLSGVITPPAKPTPIPTPEVKPLPIAAPSDPKFLYTRDRKRAQLVVAAIETGPHVIAEKEFITNILSDRGFEVENRVISPDAESIRSLLKGGSKNYDILITGVNLGFMGNYLFPYLHSGQSENGFNFSKIRNPNLDILLEELKNKELSPESL